MKSKIPNEKRAGWIARRGRSKRRLERSDRVRLTVFRSARHMYALLVDPESGKTIASVSTRSPEVAKTLEATANIEAAKRVGAAVAALAKERNIERVVFNRNGFLFHGRVKALAEAAREAGLQF